MTRSDGDLAGFQPIVDTFTLQRRNIAAFVVGILFYSMVFWAAVGAVAMFAWSRYRARHPDRFAKKYIPIAGVHKGVFTVQMKTVSGEDEDHFDDDDGLPTGSIEDVLQIGAKGEIEKCHMVCIESNNKSHTKKKKRSDGFVLHDLFEPETPVVRHVYLKNPEDPSSDREEVLSPREYPDEWRAKKPKRGQRRPLVFLPTHDEDPIEAKAEDTPSSIPMVRSQRPSHETRRYDDWFAAATAGVQPSRECVDVLDGYDVRE